MSALVVADVVVRQDTVGRFCLNDLHRAAGGEKRIKPAYFLARQETAALAAEIEAEKAGIPAFSVVRGRNGGTFVCEDLVYSYAMWISASFCLRVIRAYKATHGRDLGNAMGYFRRRIDLEGRDAGSKASATYGSRLMLDRRRKLPGFKAERALLAQEMEPELQLFSGA